MTGFTLLMALFFTVSGSPLPAHAQPNSFPVKETVKTAKPYRILTSGKLVTVKSTKDIKSIMVWTANGHRVFEQKEINNNNYNFRITVSGKVFFLMVQLVDGKTYSEKIGVEG